MPNLSPLNFQALIANSRQASAEAAEKADGGGRRRPIECWRCPECLDVHDDEFDAEECCADLEAEKQPTGTEPYCPVCRLKHVDHYAAADCCLWKDMAPPARWAVAASVERGSTWTQALGLQA
jgi:hypothetical protein